ncbi:MAG: molybdopterin-dependent oxidoreductase, partial [Nitrospinota bacterium]|nr:molybdopterin-dependent oxidoreductase [Nitrospinota bacterium]
MLSFELNGQPATADDLPGKTLDRLLRDDLRLTGTKVGCSPGDGDCGCCTVLIDGAPERACLVAASDVAGKRVETIEGLASNGALHPVQEAFVRTGAVQCGFCIPGFVMAAKALLEQNPRPGRDEICEGLSGVLCRCTGYNKMIEAVEQAAAFLSGGEWPPIESQVGEAADGGPLGVSVIRKDSIPKVTGEARFAADWFLEDMLHCKLLFSEHPHAEILSIDTSAAEEIPGVVLVLTSRNSPEAQKFGQKIQDIPVFAEDRVHCVGTVVAAVYAETQERAREGVAAIRVSYRELPAVFDPEEALREDAPRVHPDYPDGNRLTHAVIRRGDVDRAFEEADLVVEGDYSVPWVDHAFLEPESAVAYRDEEGRVTVVIASQNTYRERRELAGALGLPPEKVRVASPAIGGAFGGKSGISIHPYVALGVLRTDRPVKLVTNREESFLVHVKKHAMRLHYKTGVTRDGKILAVERRAISDGGAYAHGGPMILAQSTVFGAGPYDIPNLRLEGIRTYTNNLPCGAFRGYGINQSAFAM